MQAPQKPYEALDACAWPANVSTHRHPHPLSRDSGPKARSQAACRTFSMGPAPARASPSGPGRGRLSTGGSGRGPGPGPTTRAEHQRTRQAWPEPLPSPPNPVSGRKAEGSPKHTSAAKPGLPLCSEHPSSGPHPSSSRRLLRLWQPVCSALALSRSPQWEAEARPPLTAPSGSALAHATCSPGLPARSS